MAGDVYRVAMEGEDGMNWSIYGKSDATTLVEDFVKAAQKRDREMLAVEGDCIKADILHLMEVGA